VVRDIIKFCSDLSDASEKEGELQELGEQCNGSNGSTFNDDIQQCAKTTVSIYFDYLVFFSGFRYIFPESISLMRS